jgi:CubicO group peptidase (beta-lactamase class C family)
MLTESNNSRTPIPKGVIHLKTNARKFTLIILGLIAVQCLVPQRLEAQEEPAPDQPTQTEPAIRTPEEMAAKVDKYMNYQVSENNFSGSILVARDGRPIISKGYGKANIELNVPNTPQTVFRIGSITKQFTGMAIMILQERGKLKVSDSICKYLTNCPKAWKPITLRNLLTHTSGIWNYTNAVDFIKTTTQPLTRTQLIDQFRNKPLEFTPGENWSYSNSGYFLLGMVIERTSRHSYAAFLHENIFKPLGMNETGLDTGYRVVKNLATGYTKAQNGSVIPNPYTSLNVFSDGALVSTTEDLLLWDQALYTEQLVKQKSLQEIFTSFKSKNGQDFRYGYGWGLGYMLGHPTLFHNGGVFGFATLILRFPVERTTIIVLTNSDTSNVDGVAPTLSALALP